MRHFFNKPSPEAIMAGTCPNHSEGYHTFHPTADPRYLVCSCGYVHAIEPCSCCGADYAFCPCRFLRDQGCEIHQAPIGYPF